MLTKQTTGVSINNKIGPAPVAEAATISITSTAASVISSNQDSVALTTAVSLMASSKDGTTDDSSSMDENRVVDVDDSSLKDEQNDVEDVLLKYVFIRLCTISFCALFSVEKNTLGPLRKRARYTAT